MLLGKVTDKQDTTGTVLEEHLVEVTEEQVKEAVLSFTGEYMQVPPMYSALKVNGKKLCDLARAGVTVERQARPVQLYSIEIIKMELPRVCMRVRCSKGTYIRTLCQDIGEKLSCGACMESLLRTKVSEFCPSKGRRLLSLYQDTQEALPPHPDRVSLCVRFSLFLKYLLVLRPHQRMYILFLCIH